MPLAQLWMLLRLPGLLRREKMAHLPPGILWKGLLWQDQEVRGHGSHLIHTQGWGGDRSRGRPCQVLCHFGATKERDEQSPQVGTTITFQFPDNLILSQDETGMSTKALAALRSTQLPSQQPLMLKPQKLSLRVRHVPGSGFSPLLTHMSFYRCC